MSEWRQARLSAEAALALYERLAARARERLQVPAAHEYLFRTDYPEALASYQQLYLDQWGTRTVAPRPDDAICQRCETFHLGHRKQIDKQADIAWMRPAEELLRQFVQWAINQELQRRGRGELRVRCLRADETDKRMPDCKVVSSSNPQHVLGFFEVKCIFRPFLQVARHVADASFACYSHSLTLDTGNKLDNQLLRLRLSPRHDYLYWYDIPRLKGLFWMSADAVEEVRRRQTGYTRRRVPGDLDQASGRQVGNIDKIYLPLVEMYDFGQLLAKYCEAAERYSPRQQPASGNDIPLSPSQPSALRSHWDA